MGNDGKCRFYQSEDPPEVARKGQTLLEEPGARLSTAAAFTIVFASASGLHMLAGRLFQLNRISFIVIRCY